MKTTKLVAIAAAAALGLSGCSLVSGSGGPKGSSPESDQKQADRMKAAARATAPQPQHTLASHNGNLDGDMTATVTSLIRDGNTVTLSYTLYNKSDLGASLANTALSSDDNDDADNVTLIDGKNKKKYLVARDAKGICVCSHAAVMSAQSTIGMSSTFAAPPTAVDHITVEIPGFEPFYEIPIK
jgi:hypothetical protein